MPGFVPGLNKVKMDAHVLHIVSFAVVIALGGGLMVYKKNRKRWQCRRMKRRLTKRPSNGMPSDYLLNAIERECTGIKIVEEKNGVNFRTTDGCLCGGITCEQGLLHTFYTFNCPTRLKIILKRWHGEQEWQCVSSLMNCGCYCTK